MTEINNKNLKNWTEQRALLLILLLIFIPLIKKEVRRSSASRESQIWFGVEMKNPDGNVIYFE
jgi:hypothetical protein